MKLCSQLVLAVGWLALAAALQQFQVGDPSEPSCWARLADAMSARDRFDDAPWRLGGPAAASSASPAAVAGTGTQAASTPCPIAGFEDAVTDYIQAARGSGDGSARKKRHLR